jgi:hypothetical protein
MCAVAQQDRVTSAMCGPPPHPSMSGTSPATPASTQPMTIDTDLTDRTDVSVLVAHVSFAIGAAVAQRLTGYAAVTLVQANTLLFGRDEHPCDLLLLCPYMTPVERDGILERMNSREHPPQAILELRDSLDGARVYVRGEWNDDLAHRLDAVLADLALPLEVPDA